MGRLWSKPPVQAGTAPFRSRLDPAWLGAEARASILRFRTRRRRPAPLLPGSSPRSTAKRRRLHSRPEGSAPRHQQPPDRDTPSDRNTAASRRGPASIRSRPESIPLMPGIRRNPRTADSLAARARIPSIACAGHHEPGWLTKRSGRALEGRNPWSPVFLQHCPRCVIPRRRRQGVTQEGVTDDAFSRRQRRIVATSATQIRDTQAAF